MLTQYIAQYCALHGDVDHVICEVGGGYTDAMACLDKPLPKGLEGKVDYVVIVREVHDEEGVKTEEIERLNLRR